ncbi:MAG: hypothetical protein JKY70_03485 [Mucilaginibacter sp.]|nr:hypothetical protein [Mucilaginibacter sp.]
MSDFPTYQPLNEYKTRYFELHSANTSEFFENCIKLGNIDEDANKKAVEKINQQRIKLTKTGSSLNKKRALKTFLIVIITLAISVFVAFSFMMYQQPNLQGFLVMAGSGGLAVYLFILVKNKITASIKNLDQAKQSLTEELEALTAEAWAQMKPLISQFNSATAARLSEKTHPLIQLDDKFGIRRFAYLSQKFGLWDNDDINVSTLFVQSGEIKGNPFCFFKTLNHYMSEKTYHGSKTIYWTESYCDSNGNSQTRSRSETLRASVTRPFPAYYKDTYLVYGNEAAPNLLFNREKSKANELNEKQLEKHIKSKSKEIEKLMRTKIAKGENFTVMGNTEFEVLFGAANRNNEVEFRLLFTPMAQREMLNLIKDKNVAWGDNFSFKKHYMLNIIGAKHLQNIDVSGSTSNYIDYDLVQMRSKFNSYNNLYFKSIYFAFAPLLAISLYQDHKPHEFIYKDIYKQRFSNFEHERIVNNMRKSDFAPSDSVTDNILKTRFMGNGAGNEYVNVTAHGFRGEARTAYVQVWGGDGRYHDVPVNWTEYLSVSNTTNIDLLI